MVCTFKELYYATAKKWLANKPRVSILVISPSDSVNTYYYDYFMFIYCTWTSFNH